MGGMQGKHRDRRKGSAAVGRGGSSSVGTTEGPASRSLWGDLPGQLRWIQCWNLRGGDAAKRGHGHDVAMQWHSLGSMRGAKGGCSVKLKVPSTT